MYGWDIVEGGGHPIPIEIPAFESSPNMNMVGLTLQLKSSIWSIGKAALMDIGFFVLKGILERRKINFM